ncbi:hypothetical protein AAGS40_29745 (plasmid) [Paraburkholderia sp. PREW-6R]|uniref:hypothetical protein n=1 Tax=Paraburkholderia sp. PREW-6R TaxID=3141544 RepID=UPI0031F5A40B
METLKILVIEESAAFRDFIMSAVAQIDLTPVAPPLVEHASTKAQLLQQLSADPHRFDMVVCHWEALFNDDTESFAATKARFPQVAFVCNSASNSLNVPRRVLKAGAAGFFRRDCPGEMVRNVIGLVLGGEAFALPDHLR